MSEPSGAASHSGVKLRTARVKTGEDRKRQLEKFQVVMLESGQQEEFEELYHRGVRHECSDAVSPGWGEKPTQPDGCMPPSSSQLSALL